MNRTAAKTLADRLTCFIDGLCKTIGTDAHARGIEAPARGRPGTACDCSETG
jgi:hypothetical protein